MLTPRVRIASDMELAIRVGNLSQSIFLQPVNGYLCPEYDLEQEKREDLWLCQIEGKNFSRALFICGFLHTFSMAFRLRQAGYELETWYYMSHEKLCRKEHKS